MVQGVRRRYAAHVGIVRAESPGQLREEFGRIVAGRRVGAAQLLLDAQARLVQLPVLELGREYLIGQRSLFAEYLQQKEILEPVPVTLFRRIERRACDDPVEGL